MPLVMSHLSQIEGAVKEIVETKKQGAFGDGTLVSKIFHEMQKQRENENKKRRQNLSKSISTLTKLTGARPMSPGEVQHALGEPPAK